MTDQQRLFADQYLVLNNGTKAAIAAGYSEKSARSQASQLLVVEEIEEYIEERRKEISKISLVDAAWVQTRFKEISDRCMTAEPVMSQGLPTGEYEFDSSGANKATEMLGKIIGIFEKDNKQKESTATVTIFELPDNGRK